MSTLTKFQNAQNNSIYESALEELKAGRKRGHWMWYIFPQIAGLGESEISKTYAIANITEARNYLNDKVLGKRLRECIRIVLQHSDRTPNTIFGYPDDLKFGSCLTLFEIADPMEPLFREALEVFFDGKRDLKTVEILKHE